MIFRFVYGTWVFEGMVRRCHNGYIDYKKAGYSYPVPAMRHDFIVDPMRQHFILVCPD